MLFGLKRLLPTIEESALDEAAIYRLEALYARPTRGNLRPGLLQCPICGTRASRFNPFGLADRPNAQCPTCGSVERHRLLWLFLTRYTDLLRRRLRVLHTAPEPCFEPRLRACHGRGYVTVDRFDPHVDRQADLTALPFADASFDVFLCSHVLEHVPHDAAALAELSRVTRPGGWGVIMVPFDPARPTFEDPAIDTPAGRMAAYGHPYHYRIYGADLPDRLRGVGFDVRTISTKRLFPGHQRRRYRLNNNSLILCRKPFDPAMTPQSATRMI